MAGCCGHSNEGGNFLTSCMTVSFTRTLLHGVGRFVRYLVMCSRPHVVFVATYAANLPAKQNVTLTHEFDDL
jgi:hypothetical protein